jgi:hypothetical protein
VAQHCRNEQAEYHAHEMDKKSPEFAKAKGEYYACLRDYLVAPGAMVFEVKKPFKLPSTNSVN